MNERLEAVRQHHRPLALRHGEERLAIGPAGGPHVHQILDVGSALEQREGDLGGCMAPVEIFDQQIDDGRPAERAGELLSERREVLQRRSVGSFRKDREGGL